MNVNGGFGVFEESRSKGFLRRSLLWHRAKDVKGVDTTTLTRIKFPPYREKVPSWSWMAVSGAIDYLPLHFDRFDWQDIQSPWSRPAEAQTYRRMTDMNGADSIIFDTPARSGKDDTIAIVLGIEKGDGPVADKRHYVLVVVPCQSADAQGRTLCERVGAGYLIGHCLAGDPKTVYIT
jgi:hypothetical protein